MRYVLDTNILSDLVRNPNGQVAQNIRRVGESNVCTSVIAAAELRYGAEKKQSPKLTSQVTAILDAIEIVPLEVPADAVYGKVRAQSEKTGKVVGGNDLLIASQALALGYTVVTDNVREFKLVKGLRCENWLRPA
jgi:tRNA(fMet)-specific endonuclease VapC